jgi:DNA polymerase I-like protein with 3'-5' exonuclease and polymerase domains
MPITLNYYGAHTGRWSGALNLNQQNLPRIPRDKDGNIIDRPTNVLRKSLRAPDGYKVVVADLSGIELRVNHFLWKVPSSMALFRADPEKADLYKDFASSLYEKDVADITKSERQVGKVAHLGLGFGAGASTFQKVAKIMAGIDLAEDESDKVVQSWRAAYPEIVKGWADCNDSLQLIASLHGSQQGEAIDPWGMCIPVENGIKTPRGMIRYPDLRKERNEQGKLSWVYGTGRNKKYIYGGRIVENLVQHLARCALADNILELRGKGLKLAHTVHDELIYVVPESQAEDTLALVQSVMRTPPFWWPELVVWSEGDVGQTYGDAK